MTPNTTPTRRHQPARPCGRRADRASPGTAQHVACILVLAHRRMRRSACGGTVILTSRERAGFVARVCPLPFGGWRSCATVTCGAYVRDITVLVRERQFIEDIAFRSASRYVIDLASQTRRTFVASRHRGAGPRVVNSRHPCGPYQVNFLPTSLRLHIRICVHAQT